VVFVSVFIPYEVMHSTKHGTTKIGKACLLALYGYMSPYHKRTDQHSDLEVLPHYKN
jgi:hypothetical protein